MAGKRRAPRARALSPASAPPWMRSVETNDLKTGGRSGAVIGLGSAACASSKARRAMSLALKNVRPYAFRAYVPGTKPP